MSQCKLDATAREKTVSHEGLWKFMLRHFELGSKVLNAERDSYSKYDTEEMERDKIQLRELLRTEVCEVEQALNIDEDETPKMRSLYDKDNVILNYARNCDWALRYYYGSEPERWYSWFYVSMLWDLSREIPTTDWESESSTDAVENE
jgi:hypothetical protein